MNTPEMDGDRQTVRLRNEVVQLLPKEFSLLRFMLRHEGQTLSREQLLDGVWPMEMPTDRTVDDHIYRLRKKLGRWKHELRIETSRGCGYRLVLSGATSSSDPLNLDNTLGGQLRGITGTYMMYGHGAAFLTLTQNRELLGYEVDHKHRLVQKLMEGDIRYLLGEDIPFAERAPGLLLLQHLLHSGGSRGYIERALKTRLLPDAWHKEYADVLLPCMLLDWGHKEEAVRSLQKLEREVLHSNDEGLMMYVANLKLEFDLKLGDNFLAELHLQEAEALISRYPYKREEGRLFVLKGLLRYESERENALKHLDQGLDILVRSLFVPHQLSALRLITDIAAMRGWKELRSVYDAEWNRLCSRIGLDTAMALLIQEELNRHLG